MASEGFEVTSVEPVGSGFSDIRYLMDTFKKIAHNEKVKFDLLNLPIEECAFDRKFDFIFSINVMEHLEDPGLVFVSLASLLKPTAKYRFFCPNYDFPYEPHFRKWLFIRKNKAFYLKKTRVTSSRVPTHE